MRLFFAHRCVLPVSLSVKYLRPRCSVCFTGGPFSLKRGPSDSGLVQQSFRRIKTYVFVLLLSLVSVFLADLTARLSWIKWD